MTPKLAKRKTTPIPDGYFEALAAKNAPPEPKKPAVKVVKLAVRSRADTAPVEAKKHTRRTTPIVDPDEVIAQEWVPAPYQGQASLFLQKHPEAALFLEPGLRKTSTTLDAICKLIKRKKAKRFLLIAPVRVCWMVWPAEIAKWEQFSHLRFEILHGPKKEEALRRDADIYLINPHGLEWLFGVTKTRSAKGKVTFTYDTTRFEILDADSLVIDEISQFKHASSSRFQIIKPFLHGFMRRWGLTGSPAANGLLDLFGIMYVIDLGYSLGEYITHYRNAYFKPSSNGFTWEILPGLAEAIYKRIAPRVFRLEDRDWVSLPDLVLNIIKVDLPPEARKVYDALEDDFIVQMEEGTVMAANAAVASGKCRQVASGGLYLQQEIDEESGLKKGTREWVNLHNTKIEVVQELIDELNGAQVMVAYDFEHDLDRLHTAFGDKVPVMGGGTSAKKSVALGVSWNKGKIPLLFVHPAAVAYGLNLQESNAQHIILHTPIWDFELYDQLLRRLLRSGNKSAKVFLHIIVARNTVDEVIVTTTSKKNRVQGDLLAALKEYTRRRLRMRKG